MQGQQPARVGALNRGFVSLRLRLVLAFLVLSIAPLGAMTWYSYSSSARALEEAAERETSLLARELSRRTGLVMAEINDHLDGATDGESFDVSEDTSEDVLELLATVFATAPGRRDDIPFAVAPDGRIYARTDEDRVQVAGLAALTQPDAQPGTTRLADWIVVTTDDPTGSDLRLGIARPIGRSLRELRTAAVRGSGLGLSFIGMALLGILPLSTRLTRNLSRLEHGARLVAAGNYRTRVRVGAHDEFGRLAETFNRMAADIERHQRAAVGQERIRRELELGRQIQRDMLPRTPWQQESIQIAATTVPAREVGGDFFNYFDLPGGRIALMVGDVSGKGVGAALLMANLQASLRARLALGQDLVSLVTELDMETGITSAESMYATLFLGLFDPRTRELRYVNAGHNPPCHRRWSGAVEYLTATGRPVGLLAGGRYAEHQVALEPGDRLLCYTDGCVDAEDSLGGHFGTDALERAFPAGGTGCAQTLLGSVNDALARFRGSREPLDDATVMVVTVA
jgi:serine phosphatase RsbU (regulator of sigma subunit)